LNVERSVNEYLSCCIEESKNEGKLTMIQPHLLTCLIQISEKRLKGKASPKMLRPAFVLGTWIHVTNLSENLSKMVLSRYSESVQTKMILIYLLRTFIRSCMRYTQRNFWKIVKFTVPDRIGRVLEISFAINH
jgi:hypothetical protein